MTRRGGFRKSVRDLALQSMTWYVRRLRSMSAGEVLWRVQQTFRDGVDRFVWPRRVRRTSWERLAASADNATLTDARIIGPHLNVGDRLVERPSDGDRRSVLRRADAALAHRFSFFDLTEVQLGNPVEWNREVKAGKLAPLTFSPRLDYRDTSRVGDCKLVWEPNRHQHLVALGQAYALTHDLRYARELVAQIQSWMAQCPFGFGMNWRSPLELAIRLINWAWALALIEPSGLPSSPLRERILECAYRHMWDIRRKYSRFSSANNHAVGEAAGVFIGASYFRGFGAAGRMRDEARAILHRQIAAQTHDDGGNREQAFGYHLFVLEFFLLCALVGRRIGEEFSAEYLSRLRAMAEFAGAVLAGGPAVMFGDADDGYVLGIEALKGRLPGLIRSTFTFLGLPGPVPQNNENLDYDFWLTGDIRPRATPAEPDAGCDRTSRGGGAAAGCGLRSMRFPQTGLYLLQGSDAEGRKISVTVDGGPLGFDPLAAHGHADALAMTLRIAGVPILIDPGTFDYFTYPAWRSYFRGTRAHNTILVDGLDQSEMSGAFLWGRRASCRCAAWEPNGVGGRVVAEHDGYRALRDPVVHRRTVDLDTRQRTLVVTDELRAERHHTALQVWHLGGGCYSAGEADNVMRIRGEGVHVRFCSDPALELSLHRGETDPIRGWFSPGYHRREPIVTVEGCAEFTGPLTLVTRFEWHGSP